MATAGQSLILKRASASRPSGEWDDDDFDVLADGVVVGRIFNSNAGPVGSPLDVDADLWLPRGPLPHSRLRADTRGRDGGIRAGVLIKRAAMSAMRGNPEIICSF
jgi:hypothetical protein